MRIYKPSETHLALHPERDIKTCSNQGCGVKFAARLAAEGEDENPDWCLTCNRREWSRIWNSNKPIAKESHLEVREIVQGSESAQDSDIEPNPIVFEADNHDAEDFDFEENDPLWSN